MFVNTLRLFSVNVKTFLGIKPAMLSGSGRIKSNRAPHKSHSRFQEQSRLILLMA